MRGLGDGLRMGMALAWLLLLPAGSGWAESVGGVPQLALDTRWAVYYSDAAPVAEFDPYRLLVLDARHHPRLSQLANRGKLLLGYLSLGEVERTQDHFARLQQQGAVLMESANWPGSFLIDLRHPDWTRLVVEELVPALLRRGFHGLFLDTLDDAAHLERLDPERYRGMTEAGARLVRAIRHHYPGLPLMMNRGFELLPEVGGQLDLLLAESLRSDYDFAAKRYQRTDEAGYRHLLGLIEAARRRFPNLQVLSLDYWPADDPEGIAELYRFARANGLIPYVATVALDRLVPEPPRTRP